MPKYCKKCKKVYDDTKEYCLICNSKLLDINGKKGDKSEGELDDGTIAAISTLLL
jgi:hypothetical protein